MFDKIEELLELGGIKKDITLLVISAISLILSFLNLDLPFNPAWISIILCGVPILLEAIIGLLTRFDIKADVLVSIALIASICINEIFAAGEVAFIMQLGGLLEDLTVKKAHEEQEKLVKLTPLTARLVIDGKEEIIEANKVKVGDILKVLPGENISVDGIIIEGNTSINQSAITGESLPVDKVVNDEVYSGTINQYGSFLMKATKVGEDSSIQRMIALIKSADASKAKIVGIADKWATWIVIIALSAALITYLITGLIIRAVTILVVFCPCSLVLATPTAIMAAIGNATKYGFLIKEGDALERLAKVDTITFDKTGTLTYGKPEVIEYKSIDPSLSNEELFKIIASVENYSEHPLAKAIVKSYKNKFNDKLLKVDEFNIVVGGGVKATLNNKNILIGNSNLLTNNNIKCKEVNNNGSTLIYISIDNDVKGYVVLEDTLREDSINTINKLKALNINPILLTGDNKIVASNIANKLGIKDVKANCLPIDKLEYIKLLNKDNKNVCMIGDGINDAAALKSALVGIAMGGIGSDIAIEASDIALIKDDIKQLPHLLSLSRRMMKTIKFNLSFSMLLNFASIVLAIIGTLNPIIGALVHNAGSVFVIINSAFLLNWKEKSNA